MTIRLLLTALALALPMTYGVVGFVAARSRARL